MAPEHFQWEPDGKYVALGVFLRVTLQDSLHRGTGLLGGPSVDVNAVGIARPEVESQERLENARLCEEKT